MVGLAEQWERVRNSREAYDESEDNKDYKILWLSMVGVSDDVGDMGKKFKGITKEGVASNSWKKHLAWTLELEPETLGTESKYHVEQEMFFFFSMDDEELGKFSCRLGYSFEFLTNFYQLYYANTCYCLLQYFTVFLLFT